MTRSSPVSCLLLLLALTTAPPVSKGDDEADVAALDASRVRPLADVLAQARRIAPGKIIDVELESDLDRDDAGHVARWVYEVEVLTAGNRVVEMEFDAYTGLLLEIEGAPWPKDIARPPP
ncbi:MAG: PepSY domain-containing protein [Steroidobacteraceae bacterium]